jgi:hypothetical protein
VPVGELDLLDVTGVQRICVAHGPSRVRCLQETLQETLKFLAKPATIE